MSRKREFPDTYIDPWTGEEKKVASWDDENSPPLNSVLRLYQSDGSEFTDGSQSFHEGQTSEAQKRQVRINAQRLAWCYLAFGLIFLFLNFWIFGGFYSR
jgi:hypothetical protein